MASAPARVEESLHGYMKGMVKSVPSGDVIVVVSTTTPPQEKEITLSNIQAPKLARKTGTRVDEPYAWASREFLRKMLLGKLIFFKEDYTLPTVNRSFASVLLGNASVGAEVLRNGLAKLRPPPASNPAAAAANLEMLIAAEEAAKTEAIGVWAKVTPPEAVRTLPASYFGDAAVDAETFVESRKGEALRGIVEFVRDGSTFRILLLDDFNIVMAHLAGVQCPSAGRRGTPAPAPTTALPDGAVAADASAAGAPAPAPRVNVTSAALSTAQRLAMLQAHKLPVTSPSVPAPVPVAPTMAAVAALSVNADVPPEPYGIEAKKWVESHLLNREVRFVPESFNNNNVFGSIHFDLDGSLANLAVELVKLGYARVVEGSARSLPEATRLQLKATELQGKKTKLGIWENFVPPPSNSNAVRNDEFVGQVVEVVSPDCVVVADDGGAVERRINLSSVRAPKMGGRNGIPEPWAAEGKEFLRAKLIGKQVVVILEYERSVPLPSGDGERVMQFGTVVCVSSDGPAPVAKSRPASGKVATDGIEGIEPAFISVSVNGTTYSGVNVAEMLLLNGVGEAEKHRDFDERSAFFENLYNAEKAAEKAKRGKHSGRDRQAARMADLTTSASESKLRGKSLFSSFQRSSGRVQAVVEYVMSGHRLKLVVPSQSCKIFFSLSAVRCPGKGEPFSDDAMAFSRRHALQRDVEVEVEAQDKMGTFLGRCFVNGKNLALMLVEAGLARRLPSFGNRRIAGEDELIAAESRAKARKLKVWENFVEGEDDAARAATSSGPGDATPTFSKISVCEVLVGGEFYYHNEEEKPRVQAMEAQLAELDFSAPAVNFNPKKNDVVAVRWDEATWCRATITGPPGAGGSRGETEFDIVFVDYGNKDRVPLSRIRPLPPALSGAPGLAHLAKLSHIKVADDEDGWGTAAAQHLQSLFQDSDGSPRVLVARIDGRDFVPGKGSMVLVTVSFTGSASSPDAASVNALMLQAGFARLDRTSLTKLSATEKEALQAFQEQAKKEHAGIWRYGDVDSDDEDDAGRGRGARNKARNGGGK